MRVSSSPLDIIPTKFLIEIKECFGPHLLTILNSSLSAGCVPDYFKTACIQPVLKKPGLDPNILDSFRPISKLPFISKILEKAAAGSYGKQ
jgi:hypothetical protein